MSDFQKFNFHGHFSSHTADTNNNYNDKGLRFRSNSNDLNDLLNHNYELVENIDTIEKSL